jgi:glutamate synthase (NADPH/NADH) large chain
VNSDTLTWQRVVHPHWAGVLRGLVERHAAETNSRYARMMLLDWARALPQFWQVVPKDYVKYLPVPLAEAEALRA